MNFTRLSFNPLFWSFSKIIIFFFKIPPPPLPSLPKMNIFSFGFPFGARIGLLIYQYSHQGLPRFFQFEGASPRPLIKNREIIWIAQQYLWSNKMNTIGGRGERHYGIFFFHFLLFFFLSKKNIEWMINKFPSISMWNFLLPFFFFWLSIFTTNHFFFLEEY